MQDTVLVHLLRLLLVALLVVVPAAVRAAPADCPAMAAAPSCHESAPEDDTAPKAATAGCCEAYCATSAVLPAAPAFAGMSVRALLAARAPDATVSIGTYPTDPPPRLS